MKHILMHLYEKIFDECFCKDNPVHRHKMTAAVYLLQELGGLYGWDFIWVNYAGPISIDLRAEMDDLSYRLINFSQDMCDHIQTVKTMLNNPVGYASDVWAKCLASLVYLRYEIMPIYASDDEIIYDLEARIPEMSDHDANLCALGRINEVF